MATGRAIEKQTLIYRGKENFTSEQGVTYRCLVFSLVEYVNNKEKEVICELGQVDDLLVSRVSQNLQRPQDRKSGNAK